MSSPKAYYSDTKKTRRDRPSVQAMDRGTGVSLMSPAPVIFVYISYNMGPLHNLSRDFSSLFCFFGGFRQSKKFSRVYQNQRLERTPQRPWGVAPAIKPVDETTEKGARVLRFWNNETEGRAIMDPLDSAADYEAWTDVLKLRGGETF